MTGDAALREQRAAELYENELGTDAASRQRSAALERFVCCGELRADGHHEDCSLWKPTVHPDQEALL